MKDWIECLDEDEDVDYLVVSRRRSDYCDGTDRERELFKLTCELAERGFFVVARTANCSICKKTVCSKPHSLPSIPHSR